MTPTNEAIRARDLAVLWHPTTQMKDHEWLPLLPVRRGEGVWLEDFEGKDPQTTMDLGRIRASGKYLLALIDDVLDISKLEARRLTLDNQLVSLPELLEELRAMAEPLARANMNQLEMKRQPL